MTARPIRMTVTALAGIPEIRPGDDPATIISDAAAAHGETTAHAPVVLLAPTTTSGQRWLGRRCTPPGAPPR